MNEINLKALRIKRNISLDKISKDLNIRKCYIKALEEDNIEIIPKGPFYIGYLKMYMDYLGIKNVKNFNKDNMQNKISTLNQTNRLILNRLNLNYIIVFFIILGSILLYSNIHKNNRDNIIRNILNNDFSRFHYKSQLINRIMLVNSLLKIN